jgi:hypothetical protein
MRKSQVPRWYTRFQASIMDKLLSIVGMSRTIGVPFTSKVRSTLLRYASHSG